MNDFISRADAIEKIRKKLQDWGSYTFEDYRRGLYEAQDIIESLPSAQPKRGEWIIDKEPSTQYGTIEFECSVCGMPYSNEHRKGAKIGWWFCPNCGADMRDAETIEYHKTLGDRWSGYGRKRR